MAPNETWSKRQAMKLIILTKFHNDSLKIVDFFFVIGKFLYCQVFYGPVTSAGPLRSLSAPEIPESKHCM